MKQIYWIASVEKGLLWVGPYDLLHYSNYDGVYFPKSKIGYPRGWDKNRVSYPEVGCHGSFGQKAFKEFNYWREAGRVRPVLNYDDRLYRFKNKRFEYMRNIGKFVSVYSEGIKAETKMMIDRHYPDEVLSRVELIGPQGIPTEDYYKDLKQRKPELFTR
ncbi:MAG: hypothetical protein KAS32_08865 [Candidatus Peribacteraceae bacterium]|nr:hypothetical protein [Candidatus Peribacteraceae bacterium]